MAKNDGLKMGQLLGHFIAILVHSFSPTVFYTFSFYVIAKPCSTSATLIAPIPDSGRIPELLHSALRGWEARNVGQFGAPRVSGDDCHETASTQLEYFRRAGLTATRVIWQRDLWAILCGRKPVSASDS